MKDTFRQFRIDIAKHQSFKIFPDIMQGLGSLQDKVQTFVMLRGDGGHENRTDRQTALTGRVIETFPQDFATRIIPGLGIQQMCDPSVPDRMSHIMLHRTNHPALGHAISPPCYAVTEPMKQSPDGHILP